MTGQTVREMSNAALAGAFHTEGKFLEDALQVAEVRRERFAVVRQELERRKLIGDNGLPLIDSEGKRVVTE